MAEEVGKLGDKGKARLVTLLVDKRRAGEEEPELTIDLIRQAEVNPDLTLEERARRLLRFLIEESDGMLGRAVGISGDKIEPLLAWIESTTSLDLLLAWRIESRTKNEPCVPVEIRLLCDHLVGQGFISYFEGQESVYVTVNGYAEAEREGAGARPIPDAGREVSVDRTESRRIFVVHGRDGSAKLEVARFLERLELRAVILHEQPNEGRTIIEKFEDEADVAFAVVICTPDDVGYPRRKPKEKKPRARQNVVFELGFFVAALGRERVCVLHKGGIEIPSDYHGVLYVELDDGGGWQRSLAKEMRSAGIEVDLNKAM